VSWIRRLLRLIFVRRAGLLGFVAVVAQFPGSLMLLVSWYSARDQAVGGCQGQCIDQGVTGYAVWPVVAPALLMVELVCGYVLFVAYGTRGRDYRGELVTRPFAWTLITGAGLTCGVALIGFCLTQWNVGSTAQDGRDAVKVMIVSVSVGGVLALLLLVNGVRRARRADRAIASVAAS
jgi:hypothetical protein